MDIAIKHKDIVKQSRRNKRTKENYTLINNLNNISRLLKAYFISGPSSIIKYTKDSKNIYLFGEQHEEKNCSEYNIPYMKTNIHIIDYLIKLFIYTPVYIDFYA